MMRRLPSYDPTAPLPRASQLIEASAGTGKTYTIAQRFVRLVVEGHARVPQILVITFTEAATAELRERIRRALVELRTGLADPERATGDPGLARLVSAHARDRRALARVEAAVRGFDEAAIDTIHGFCRRALEEAAFESRVDFAPELETDGVETVREVVDDRWRRFVVEEHADVVRRLAERSNGRMRGVALLARELETALRTPAETADLPEPLDPRTTEAEAEEAAAAFRRVWTTDRGAVRAILTGHEALNRNKFRVATMTRLCDALDEAVADEAAASAIATIPGVAKAGATTLRDPASVKKAFGDDPFPELPAATFALTFLLERHDAHARAIRSRIAHLRRALVEWGRREVPRRRAARNARGFDDLLTGLAEALEGERGEHLARRLRERHPIALIDEFQDTDPVQYRAMRTIWPPDGPGLTLVGDPKQAIYRFRGADVFAYLKAAERAAERHTLPKNWRSHEGCVRAVAALFETHERPFVIDGIDFIPVDAAPERDARVATVDGVPLAAMRVWRIDPESSDEGKPISKRRARERADEAVASELARLLALGRQGRARVGTEAGYEALEGRHCAIVVRTNARAEAVRATLERYGVPSVQTGRTSVFETREAEELRRVLAATARPGDEGRLRAALATELLGYDARAIAETTADEAAHARVVEALREVARRGRSGGPFAWLERLDAEFDVSRRTVTFTDGERRLTNLRHLVEEMHAAEVAGPDEALAWIDARIASPDRTRDEEMLRLETDAELVQVVTVHRSKGLEYPVVFCVDLWDAENDSARADEALVYHDPDRENAVVVDYGSGDRDRALERKREEDLAEELRVAYVAWTRASCHVTWCWGAVRDAARSAPAWLLASTDGRPPGRLDAATVSEALDRLARRAPGAVAVEPLPDDTAPPLAGLASDRALGLARRLSRPILPSRRLVSFSAMVRAGGDVERPDRDLEVDRDVPSTDRARGGGVPADGGADAFDFPGGPDAGTALHAIFERLDFAAAPREAVELEVAATLRRYGFDAAWVDPVSTLVERVLDTPIDAGPPGASTLRGVSSRARAVELEFHLPLRAFRFEHFKGVLRAHAGPAVAYDTGDVDALVFDDVPGGFLKGFIDLVWVDGGRYRIADYKSNRLGDRIEAYGPAPLDAEMARHRYWLQALVYAVALHRHLRERLGPAYVPERDFGGVRYLFVRGMRPELPGHAVRRIEPSVALLEALDTALDAERA